jgi:hypothetical protein
VPREKIAPASLTPGQLARRWGVSADRVRGLLRAGLLPGAFTIPSAGKYGETTKIPMATVIDVEMSWQMPIEAGHRQRHRRADRGRGSGGLKHFAKLIGPAESFAGSGGDA